MCFISSLDSIIGLLGELSDPMDIRTPHTGIPTEALTLYCPHIELKVSVLQEFLLIDQKYTDRLDTLDEYHADIVWYVSFPHCVWITFDQIVIFDTPYD